MAIIMGKSCLEAIYGLMGWKGLSFQLDTPHSKIKPLKDSNNVWKVSH